VAHHAERDRAARRLPQARERAGEPHLAGVGRRGALLRLDRRRAAADRRRELLDPFHAAQGRQRLERGEYRQGRAARTGRADDRAGRAAFARRRENRSGIYAYEQRPQELPAEYRARLDRNPEAARDFDARPAGYRKTAIWKVVSAKQEATRLRRLAELIDCHARGELIPELRRGPKG
jgi:hypothetical protein